MIPKDFDTFNIHNFTPKEVEETGADLNDVKIKTMISIQSFREFMRRRVHFQHNGITSGNHKAVGHKDGLAIDGYLNPLDGKTNIHIIFKGALTSGFTGIGIYWNGCMYSFHFEHRLRYAFWIGVKDKTKGIENWQWHSLLNDPAKIPLIKN